MTMSLFAVIVAALADAGPEPAVPAPTHAHAHGAPGGAVATTAIAPDGTVWVARTEEGYVLVNASRDLGRTFSPPVRVNPEPEKIDANGEARPKVALGPEGEVFVSYTRRLDKPYTGEVVFSRSTDGGKTFSPPVRVMDAALASGRFDLLAVAPKGEVHVFFIGRGETKEAALYHVVSTDRGRTFGASVNVKSNVCECCRLAVAWDGETPIVFWRDMVAGGVRDHCVARLDSDAKEPTVARATDDGWEIAACPHHGPALAIGTGGVQHFAWFTGEGRRGKGAFYRRSTDGGTTFSAPVRLGGDDAGHPDVLARGTVVWAAWKEPRAGDTTVVVAMRSDDAGVTWSKPAEIARTPKGSDHPLLVAHGDEAFLSWMTQDEGLRLLPLAPVNAVTTRR